MVGKKETPQANEARQIKEAKQEVSRKARAKKDDLKNAYRIIFEALREYKGKAVLRKGKRTWLADEYISNPKFKALLK